MPGACGFAKYVDEDGDRCSKEYLRIVDIISDVVFSITYSAVGSVFGGAAVA